MKLRILLIFLILFVFGSWLRLWQLGKFPPGFYSDEALYGYEAYSLLMTGKDQFANAWPLTIAGFGDYRPALYIYYTVPYIFFLGLTEFATRLPSTFASIGTIVATFFLIRIVTKSQRTALLGMLVMVLSPWSLFFGRMAHETNLMTFFIASGTFFMWRARKCAFCVVPAALCFAASLYTYHSARVFIPLLLLMTTILSWQLIAKNKKRVLVGGILFLVLLLPLAFEFTKPATWSRVHGASFWNDPGIVSFINEARGKTLEKGWPVFLSKLIYSKPVVYSHRFSKNFISHFDPKFLLTEGDKNGIYNTPHTGILLWSEIALIPLGVFILSKQNKKIFWWAIFAIIFALIPDSLTRLAPSSPRIHLALPFTALLSGVGFRYLLKKNHTLFIVTGILLILSSLWFWKNYLIDLPKVHEETWQVNAKELIVKAHAYKYLFPKIWISRYGYGWIHLVFHTQYDPAILQAEIRHSEPNELGFWWVSDIDGYHLDWLPKLAAMDCVTLYIAPPTEFSDSMKVIDSIKNSENKDIFWFALNSSCVPDIDNELFDLNNGYL